jgi:hypothetical protein
MTPSRAVLRASPASWRESFVEELGVLGKDVGVPRGVARVLGWMVVCDPPEQSARDIQQGVELSAGAVSTATRMLVATRLLERTARPGDRRSYYRLRPGGWDGTLEVRLRALTQLREVADRALQAAGGRADDRLRNMRDAYAWFEQRLMGVLGERPSRP